MNNTTTLLMKDLSLLKGKSADHITHFLKRYGGGEEGTMADGILDIVGMFNADKSICVKKAQRNGIVIGTICTTAIAGSIYLYKYYEKYKNRKKIQKVIEILKQEALLVDEEQLPVDKNGSY